MQPHALDIRSIAPAKGEPFASIMAAVDALGPGQQLLLTAPFKPEPLLRLLRGKGFENQCTVDEHGVWQVLFTPVASNDPVLDPADPLTWPRPSVLVDLSGTEPGAASAAVLDAAAPLERGQVLFALLSEEPMDLPYRLLDEGHFCFGRWQDGTYRVMVLVMGDAGGPV